MIELIYYFQRDPTRVRAYATQVTDTMLRDCKNLLGMHKKWLEKQPHSGYVGKEQKHVLP
uniref:Uncharacterized protein n=1 Tax=Arion vulgaris TaxID=1028688 RepID=A0A0B7B1C7_9EUPU